MNNLQTDIKSNQSQNISRMAIRIRQILAES